jgi:hypothetical protein
MSCSTLFEAMENKDIFAVSLEITRPEAAIADPSKL